MDGPRRLAAGGVAGLGLLALVALIAWSAVDDAPDRPRAANVDPGRPGAGAPASAGGVAPEAAPAELDNATRRVGPAELAPPPEGGAPALPAGERQEFPDPDAAEDFVDAKVSELLTTVRPELDLTTVRRSCTDDGRHCAFEGPWLGDDFVKDWVRAISDRKTSSTMLEGLRFSKFEAVEGAEGKRFLLHAHSP